MSRIVTFYSYKGGVGRTFALANLAVALAKRGKRVLVMDWDLEAPGLHRYFKPYTQKPSLEKGGLIHLLQRANDSPSVEWKSYVTEIFIEGCSPISMIVSGDHRPDYVDLVRRFSWNSFFEDKTGGDVLNEWRNEWKHRFDFIFVDSRTGITDAGGVCTIYLPDILVLVFSANAQSFEQGVQVAKGIQKARRELAVQRPPLAVLPLPGRFDGRDEVDEAQTWLTRFSEELRPFYDDWLDKALTPRQILELTKIPYVAKFSFGEPLPVITQGISDPEFPGFYFENVARLLLSDFKEAAQIVSPELSDDVRAAEELRSLLTELPVDEMAVAAIISRLETVGGPSIRLAKLLQEAGSVLLRQQRFEQAESYLRRAVSLFTDIGGLQDLGAISAKNSLAQLLVASSRLSEAELLYRQILEAESDLDYATRAAAFSNIANVCRQMGRQDEALNWYRQALDAYEASVEPGDPAILATYNNMAGLYRDLGRYEEAVLWFERAIRAAEISGGTLRSNALATFGNLAGVYRDMGRHEEALMWYHRALKTAEMISPRGDSVVLTTYNNLAGAYRDMGRHEEALMWYTRALEAAETSKRRSDPAFLIAYNNLAGAYRDMGRHKEALMWYTRALEAAETSKRRSDPAVLIAYNNLVGAYRDMGRHEEALMWCERALKTAEMISPRGDSVVLATYTNLAGVYRDLGRYDEALMWYERALQVAENTFGIDSVQASAQVVDLANTLIQLDRPDRAEMLLRGVVSKFARVFSGESAIAAQIKGSLAQLLRARGREDEATAVLEGERFDVFIAHNSEDIDTVRELAAKIAQRGLRVWFDQWELRLGERLMPAINRGITSSNSILACIGRSGLGRWFELETETSRLRSEGKQIIVPVLLPGARSELIPPDLRDYNFLDLRMGVTNEGVDRLVSSIAKPKRP